MRRCAQERSPRILDVNSCMSLSTPDQQRPPRYPNLIQMHPRIHHRLTGLSRSVALGACLDPGDVAAWDDLRRVPPGVWLSGDAVSVDAVAAVNATIASILMAALALYIAQVFGPLDRLRRRINNSIFRVAELGTGIPVDVKDPDAASNGFAAVKARLTRLGKLARDKVIDGVGRDDVSRGTDVQRLLRGLISHYPFPTRLRPHPSGQGFMFDANARLQLKGRVAKEQWVRDAKYLSGNIRYTFAEHKDTLRLLLDAVTPNGSPLLDDSIFQTIPQPRPLADLRELAEAVPTEADLSLMALIALGDIADQTEKLMAERRAYLDDTPSRWPFVLVAMLGFIALICGAVVPMLHAHSSTLVTEGIPSSIYVLAGIGGLWAAYNTLRA